MSKIALSGNASGTGTFTLASPNSSTDRTLNLPDNSGTVVVTGTTPALNGITFPASQVTSADANTLDDYEEGTWTPSFINLGTVTLNYARYTKIGNTVIALCAFSCTSTPTANSSRFTLPFASNGFSAGAWSRSTVQGGQLESQNADTQCYFSSTASTSTGAFYATIVYQVA